MGKILVTGGGGFLGQHLVSRLIKQGGSVRSYSRNRCARPAPGVEYLQGDIRDIEGVDRAFEDVDVAIHLVSNFRSAASDSEAHGINVDGTNNVLECALRHRVRRLVHCSTIGVHGSVLDIPADERTAFNPCDVYQETKLAAEQRVWEVYRDTGLPISVVRPISMVGPGDERMLKLFKMIQKGSFRMIGDGSALFQPAYIDDVVEGFLLCLEKDEAVGEAFIVGGDEYLPLRDLVRLIAEEMDVEVSSLQLPMAPFLWAARACERIFSPFGIEPPLHRRRLSFFQNNRAFSIEKARRVLGFEPQVSLREGIQRTIRWYREAGWL